MSKAFGKDYGDNSTSIPAHLNWALPADAVFYVFKSQAASLQSVIDSLPTHEVKDFLDGCRSTFSELAASWYRLFHTETSYSIGLRVGVLLRGIIGEYISWDFYLEPVRLMTRRCSNCTNMEMTVVVNEIKDIVNHVCVCHAVPLRTGPGKPIVCDHHLLKRECACR
ncbi:hypothetical protein BC829DRAFT_409118 [Chytridium lagenaria]|nr:hypothetical protein BC829DRAFT_409118 [Chytridium lagenaria]